MSRHVFCRDLALAQGEPIAGTGALPERLLLLRWPRGKWRPGRRATGMSQALAAALAYASTTSPFVLFADRQDDGPALPSLLAFPESIAIADADEAMLCAAIRHWADGGRITGRAEARTTILCCTDSRTDACCARFGFATYKALAAAADPTIFNVMQTNHLGGCRFATSLVVASRRERYARLDPAEVPAFLASLAAGEPYWPAFRGRADADEPQQIAELAARRLAAGAPVGLSGPEMLAEDRLRYTARIGARSVAIDLALRDFVTPGQCSAIGAPAPTRRRWVTL